MLDPSHVFLSQGKGTIVGIFEPTNRDDKDSLSVGEHYLVWCTVDMQEYRCSFGDSVLQSEVLRGLPWRWVGERSVRHLSRALTKFIKLELKLEVHGHRRLSATPSTGGSSSTGGNFTFGSTSASGGISASASSSSSASASGGSRGSWEQEQGKGKGKGKGGWGWGWGGWGPGWY